MACIRESFDLGRRVCPPRFSLWHLDGNYVEFPFPPNEMLDRTRVHVRRIVLSGTTEAPIDISTICSERTVLNHSRLSREYSHGSECLDNPSVEQVRALRMTCPWFRLAFCSECWKIVVKCFAITWSTNYSTNWSIWIGSPTQHDLAVAPNDNLSCMAYQISLGSISRCCVLASSMLALFLKCFLLSRCLPRRLASTKLFDIPAIICLG